MNRIAYRIAYGAGATLLAAMPLLATTPARADYPDRPIRMVVPFPPGGATDVVSRQMAKSMSDDLGQTIVIENRGGAGAIIGAELVANAPPDGYTILSSTAGVHIINPAITAKLPYDPLKSWAPISQSVSAPLALVVLTSSPFKTVYELVDYAKKHPGELSYGSAGSGTSLHQSGEMFKNAAKVDILHVPYKGAGPAVNDFLGGRVTMMFSYLGSVYPNVQAGKLRILAIGSPKRVALIPDVPTIAEALGVEGYDSDTWTGFVAPAGTPPAIIRRLNKAVAYALKENRDRLLASGYLIAGGTPEEMRERIERELQTVTPLLAKLMGPSAQDK